MAFKEVGGPRRKRGPSLRGVMMKDVSAGVERSRIWPSPRGKNLHPTTQRQNEKFAKIAQACKYWPAFLQAQYREAVKGTPLLPRDLMIQVMYNRFATLNLEDGRRIFPMTAVQDVSESFDVIAQLQGEMMARGEYFWQPITAGQPGQVLTFGNVGQLPAWTAPAGGAGAYERTRVIPLAAHFTLDNPGSGGALATMTDTAYGLQLVAPASNGGFRFARLGVAMPAPPWSIMVRSTQVNPYTSNGKTECCLLLRNTANSRIIAFSEINNGFTIQRYSSYSAFVSNILATQFAQALPSTRWKRIRFTGSQIFFGFSPDGEAWAEVQVENLATYILAIDQVGVAVQCVSEGANSLFQSFEIG